MIWADRVAIVFGLLLSPIILATSDPLVAQWMLAFVALLWFVLRGMDFIASGSIRRG